MSLIDLVDNEITDKNTYHSYLSVYENLFTNKKHQNLKLLEIGIAQGGSIKLWRDYFTNGYIYGLDQSDLVSSAKVDSLKTDNNVTLITGVNAYSSDTISTHLQNNEFDIVIDDGSHSLYDMISFIKLYLPLLKDDGILVIEDIPSDDPNTQLQQWIDLLTETCPSELRKYIKVFNLVHIQGRHDDVLFVIDKSEVQN